jgi:hypothetical protein
MSTIRKVSPEIIYRILCVLMIIDKIEYGKPLPLWRTNFGKPWLIQA